MLRTSLTKKRGKAPTKEVPRTPTRQDKKANSRTIAFLNNSSDKKKTKQPPTPESSESSSDSDNDGEFEVEAILGRKVNREGKVFYRIKWKGFDLRYATWEPEENVSNAPKLIETYEKTLKAEGNDDKGDRTKRQPRDLLRKRGLDELAGRKKGGAQKNTNRRKRVESEDEEEEEEDFYDSVTDEEEVEDQEGDSESEEDQDEESESEEESEVEEDKGGRRGKKAPVVNARKGAKKLKTETVSAVPVKEVSKEKKKAEPAPVVSNETKRKSVGKLRIQEEPEEAPAVSVQQPQKEMQVEAPQVQEEKKDVVQEEKPAPVEVKAVSMQEEKEEKQAVPSKKSSIVTEPTPIQSEEAKPAAQADPDVMKKMIVEEESPEKIAAAAVTSKPDPISTKPTVSQPTKPSRDDADHATNVLRELGRTSSAFKINLEAKSDYNNLLLSRNNSGFQQPNSAFNSSKTSTIPSQKDTKHTASEVAPVNPNTNSANPLLGLLNHKDSSAVPSALSLPFGAGNPLLNNPLLYGAAAGGMNRSLDDEEARKNQIVFQGYLQISNYMLPQNNPMAAMNNNRMRSMLGANPFAAMNPLHNPFLPNSTNFPGYFGMPNPLLAANPLFPGMGMTPAMPNFFGPMAGLAGAPGNNMRNNMMFNEMMKSGLSPSSLGMLSGAGEVNQAGSGKSEKNKSGNKEIIILDDKKEDGKKKEVAEKK